MGYDGKGPANARLVPLPARPNRNAEAGRCKHWLVNNYAGRAPGPRTSWSSRKRTPRRWEAICGRERVKLIVGIIAIVMVLCGETLADAVYVYPPDHQQRDAQYTWAWDDAGGLLLDNAGPDGPVDYGWRGGGDVAWYGRDFTGDMVGKGPRVRGLLPVHL